METFKIENLSFTYPNKDLPALSNINLNINYGEFVLVCGQTGCGKSTLLRNLKSILAPHGKKEGEIFFYGRPIDSINHREQAERIGYVFQNPDNQIVTDKVWHELAFGLESLGYDSKVIRLRVAEMANFFGIQGWFLKDVSKLSGGQKQILNLASVMAMQPDVLILDEPTAQLDPIAAWDFLETVKRINREIGTTVLMIEHRLEEVFPMADRTVIMDRGVILIDDKPKVAGKRLADMGHPMLLATPVPMQIYERLGQEVNHKLHSRALEPESPIAVREGRTWLTEIFSEKMIIRDRVQDPANPVQGPNNIVQLRDVWFRYSKDDADVIKGLSMEVPENCLYCIMGGNGSGKTTALSIVSGINKPYRGKITHRETGPMQWAMLPQNPQTLFVEKTVALDLLEVLEDKKISADEKNGKLTAIANLIEIYDLLGSHPYDLSGGEQQRVALAKVLLTEPEILLLDEPTKGLDNHYKEKLGHILKRLTSDGVTIIMVSHDIEFCAKYGDYCGMIFDGDMVTSNTPRNFFSGNSFYTTAANRMSRHIFQNAITVEDVVELCKMNL